MRPVHRPAASPAGERCTPPPLASSPRLKWRDGTLYVGHSATGYAWIFSIPDHGGAKNLLYEGHVRGYWLEDQRLRYAQGRDLFDMPIAGGPPTAILHFGDRPADGANGDALSNRTLDRTAWTRP